MRTSLLTLCAIVASIVATNSHAQDGQLQEPPAGFTALFNGKDLSGWYGMKTASPEAIAKLTPENQAAKKAAETEDALKHWRAEDGAIVNDGHGPYLTTEKEYGDIELFIEYKTVPKADSGIYLRGTPQVQIWDYTDEGKFKIGADKGSGGLYNQSAGSPGRDPLMLADKPFGEWNKFRIIQIGSCTTVYLNGKLVVDNANMDNYWNRERPLYPKGPIQLQTHGGEICWRNLFVREIAPEEANEMLKKRNHTGFTSLFNGKDLTGWTGPAVPNYEVTEAGTIRCKPGKGGTLFTEEEYDDFIVKLEFKLPKAGNNGLAIRYPGKGDTAYVGMTELQILDTPGYGGKLDPRQVHGSAYGMVPAATGYLRPVGQWNYQEVTVKGSTIKVELNGTVILNTDLAEVKEFMGGRPHPGMNRTKGHFGFAGHSNPVEFQNVWIKPIK